MNKKTIPILIVLFLVMLIIGCGSEHIDARKKETTQETGETTPKKITTDAAEEVLVKEIADGKLVEVYDDYVRIKPGGIEKNWMIINNVKDKDEKFMIIPCGGCDFKNRTIDIPAGEYKIIKFKVRAMEGQKEIKVKDALNNAYGYAKISIILE